MLKKLEIENFRSFEKFEINGFQRVNLIAGANNCGKTALLEAIAWVVQGSGWTQSALRESFRASGYPNHRGAADHEKSFWSWIFYKRDLQRIIRVVVENIRSEDLVVAMSMGERALSDLKFSRPLNSSGINSRFVYSGSNSVSEKKYFLKAICIPSFPQSSTSDAEALEKAVSSSVGEQKIEKLLAKVDPRVQAVRFGREDGMDLAKVNIGLPELIPALHLGQGFCRLLRIYSEIIGSGAKILLIDEIENGLHHSALIELWKGLAELSVQEDVQIFATTHSYECILAAHKVFSGQLKSELAVHRLENIDGQIKAVTFEPELLATAVEQGFEVR